MDILDYYGNGSYQKGMSISDEDDYNPYES